jgi:hypothetical protein
MLDDYCRSMGVDENRIKSFSNFNSIYFILHGHYLKNNNITDYYLIYDDDIILQGDLQELTDCLKNKVPCLITEPLNAG